MANLEIHTNTVLVWFKTHSPNDFLRVSISKAFYRRDVCSLKLAQGCVKMMTMGERGRWLGVGWQTGKREGEWGYGLRLK